MAYTISRSLFFSLLIITIPACNWWHDESREIQVQKAADYLAQTYVYFETLRQRPDRVQKFSDAIVITMAQGLNRYNNVFFPRFGNNRKRVYEIIKPFAASRSSLRWWVNEDKRNAQLFPILKAFGFEKTEQMYVMAVDLPQTIHQTIPADVVIKRVLDADGVRDFEKVTLSHEEGSEDLLVDDAYAWFAEFAKYPPREEDDVELYVLYKDNVPVACAMLSFLANIASVHYVMTVPSEQRKGYARMMMRFLFSQARAHDEKEMVLVATEMGKPLYEHLGFVTIGKVGIYDAMF